MTIGKEELTAVGAAGAILGSIFGGLLGVFGAGRILQKEISRIDSHDKSIKYLEEAVSTIHSLFVTENGEPRLVSIKMCSDKQESFEKLFDTKHDSIVREIKIYTETVAGQGKKLDEIYRYILASKKGE